METYTADGLPQDGVYLASLIGVEVFHDTRDECGGRGEAQCGVHACTEHDEGERTGLAVQDAFGKPVTAVNDLLDGGGIGSYLVVAVVDVEGRGCRCNGVRV